MRDVWILNKMWNSNVTAVYKKHKRSNKREKIPANFEIKWENKHNGKCNFACIISDCYANNSVVACKKELGF